MQKHVLFIQGAGEGAHEADAKLVESLRHALGPDYEITFPAMPNETDASYLDWKTHIEKELTRTPEPLIVVAHSIGASVLLKCLGEFHAKKTINGIFLLATPFWGGNGWRYEGYEELGLSKDAESKLPKNAPVFLYHCQDDSIVPYQHVALYAKLFPHATVRGLKGGGHQFNNDMSLVAEDMKKLG